MQQLFCLPPEIVKNIDTIDTNLSNLHALFSDWRPVDSEITAISPVQGNEDYLLTRVSFLYKLTFRQNGNGFETPTHPILFYSIVYVRIHIAVE